VAHGILIDKHCPKATNDDVPPKDYTTYMPKNVIAYRKKINFSYAPGS
jgi:hypothetical protein